jgi:hypothetical protein
MKAAGKNKIRNFATPMTHKSLRRITLRPVIIREDLGSVRSIVVTAPLQRWTIVAEQRLANDFYRWESLL